MAEEQYGHLGFLSKNREEKKDNKNRCVGRDREKAGKGLKEEEIGERK